MIELYEQAADCFQAWGGPGVFERDRAPEGQIAGSHKHLGFVGVFEH
jgi:hypothetical protein